MMTACMVSRSRPLRLQSSLAGSRSGFAPPHPAEVQLVARWWMPGDTTTASSTRARGRSYPGQHSSVGNGPSGCPQTARLLCGLPGHRHAPKNLTPLKGFGICSTSGEECSQDVHALQRLHRFGLRPRRGAVVDATTRRLLASDATGCCGWLFSREDPECQVGQWPWVPVTPARLGEGVTRKTGGAP